MEEMEQAKTKEDDQVEGKYIDLESLAKKEKSFDQKAYIDLIKSYCTIKNQEGVDKPVNLIVEHLGHEIMSDEANKILLINMEEKAKKHLKQYSYREVANWLSTFTDRYISHIGLMKRVKRERQRKNKARTLRIWSEYAEKAIQAAKQIEEERSGARA